MASASSESNCSFFHIMQHTSLAVLAFFQKIEIPATSCCAILSMASKQEIQFWRALLKRTDATDLDNFLTKVVENPESFEIFVKHVREATYPLRDAAHDNRSLMLQRPVRTCQCYQISL